MLESFTLFTLLRNDPLVIAKWFSGVLPFINDGLLSNIHITCAAKENNHLITLASICNLTITDVEYKTISEEDPLAKNDYYRYLWNKGISEIKNDLVLVLDDDIEPDMYIIQKFFAQRLGDNVLFGMVNYRNAENLMLSKRIDKGQVIYPRDIGIDPFVIEYGAPNCMFSTLKTLKNVASNLVGIPELPYRCTGFEIARNARKQGIKLIAIPSIICKHG